MPVLSQREIFDYLESMNNGKWYEPPLSLDGLAKVYRAAVHHGSAIQVKRNILRSCFIPHPKLSLAEFTGIAMDYLIFGNGYIEQVKNVLNKPMRYQRAAAKFCRRGIESGQFWWVPSFVDCTEFNAGSIFQVMEADISQEIYGIPDYVASMNSSLLNESATLFRRRYYENGSHAGFIMYMTDTLQKEDDINKLRKALKDSKGPGNFRNLLMYSPGGSKDGIKIIPIAEVAAKDEFLSIKNVSRDDQLAAHRVPPQLMGVMLTTSAALATPRRRPKCSTATKWKACAPHSELSTTGQAKRSYASSLTPGRACPSQLSNSQTSHQQTSQALVFFCLADHYPHESSGRHHQN